MAAYCQVYGVIHFTSPAGWLPVHRDQLRTQRSVTSMGKCNLLLLILRNPLCKRVRRGRSCCDCIAGMQKNRVLHESNLTIHLTFKISLTLWCTEKTIYLTYKIQHLHSGDLNKNKISIYTRKYKISITEQNLRDFQRENKQNFILDLIKDDIVYLCWYYFPDSFLKHK